MNTSELEQVLADALAHRADRTTVPADFAFDGRTPMASPPPRWQGPAVAAAGAGLVVAGLVAVGSRNDGASGDTTVPTIPLVVTAPDDGRLALPEELGFRGWRAGDRALNHPRQGVNQLFATAAVAPETEPSLVVVAVPGNRDFVPWAEPELELGGHEVRDEPGAVLNDNERVFVAFFENGFHYRFAGRHIDQDALLAIVEAATLRRTDGSVDVSNAPLPDGVVEQTRGQWFESWLLSDTALSTFIPSATFSELSGDRFVWYLSAADPDLSRRSRVLWDEIVDITVNGSPGFIGTSASQPMHRTVIWTTGTRTVMLGGNDFTDAEMIAVAEALRPATDAEWGSMTSDQNPDGTSETVDSTVVITTPTPG